MNIVAAIGDKTKVLCCQCMLLGVHEPEVMWRCERCGGSLFWLADRSASYDEMRNIAGGDRKLARALRYANSRLGVK